MDIRVVYYSKTGNTKKVAEAIAEEMNVVAENAAEMPVVESFDLLFVGGAIYGAKLDNILIKFIEGLDPQKAGLVAVFGTFIKEDEICDQLKEAFKAKGIDVLPSTYACYGKSFLVFNRKHPDKYELEAAKVFAAKIANIAETEHKKN